MGGSIPPGALRLQQPLGVQNQQQPLVELRHSRQQLALRPEEEVPMNVVIRSEEGAVSLLVDEIGDVLDVAEETREPVPENIAGAQRELLAGVAKLDQRLLLILHTERLLQPESAGRD